MRRYSALLAAACREIAEETAPESLQSDDWFLDPERLSGISIETQQPVYTPDTTEMEIVLTNTGDRNVAFAASRFALLRYTDDGAEEITYIGKSCSCQPSGGTVYAHSSTVWTIYLREYEETALSAGEYAFCFGDKEARFTVAVS